VVIGRSPKADLAVEDFGVSRLHAKLQRRGQEITIQDLESRNGTKVNDVQVMQARLAPGDRITLGNFTLVLRAAGASTEERDVELDEHKEISEASGTIIRSHHELERLLSGAAPKTTEMRPPAIDEIERSNRILRMLTQVAKALIS
jgi:pSer/pThr/pTyr-binding forkhead associated (FHA) protein